MQASFLFVAVSAAMLVTVMANSCLMPFFYRDSGACVFGPLHPAANRDIRSIDALEHKDRHKRSAGCRPYCARGVLMVYPDFDDCRRFYLCANGQSALMYCSQVSPDTLYYHTETMRCENSTVPASHCRVYNRMQ